MYPSSPLMYLLLIFFAVYVLLNVNHSSEVSSHSPLEEGDPKIRIKRRAAADGSEARKSGRPVLNACCARNQMLDDNLECVDKGRREPNVESLVGRVTVNEEMEMSNDTKVRFNYGRKSTCSQEDVTMITWNLDTPDDFYISAEDGSLLILDRNRTITSSFNADSYCLDEISSNNRSFVGLLCPCNDRICIQKCCKDGYYFDTAENKCETGDGVGSFRPTFHQEKVVLQGNESITYFMKYRSPKCYKPDELIIKEDDNDTFIYLQLNGFLMVDSVKEGTYYFYDNSRYCLDIFSNGTEEQGTVNGFYCTEGPMVNFVYRRNTEKITEFTNAEVQELKKQKTKTKENTADGDYGRHLDRGSGEDRLKSDMTSISLFVAYVLFVNVILFDM